MTTWKLLVAAAGSALLLAACGGSNPSSSSGGCTAPSSSATASQTVNIVPDPTTVGAYSPNTLTVKAGQAVQWTWQDPNNQHSVTADDGTIDSGLQGNGCTFTFTFTKVGSVAYHCTIHSGMKGTVTVTS